MQILYGFLLALLIAFAAYRAHSLNLSGAAAAVVVGTIIFGIGGWQWAILLLAFFTTSSGLSRAFKRRKKGLNEKYAKGSQRDWGQVFGNGGLATLFAWLWFFFPGQTWVWVGFAAALAGVNADTWATELGVFNPNPPRLLTNPFKVVEKGTSGGVSLVGTLASLAGSALLGVLAVIFAPQPVSPFVGVLITLAGLFGSLFDSLLGATTQAIYTCPTCQKETEQHPTHTCGSATTLQRGLPWLQNDWVNFGCSLASAALAIALSIPLS